MTFFTVALLQMSSAGIDQDANLAKGTAFCRQAAQMGSDLALFPEMWNIGYTFFDQTDPNGHKTWMARAINRDGEYVQHFRRLAQQLDLAIALTYLEQYPGQPRNTVSLIDRHGELLFTYAKVHTCDFDAEAALSPGEDFYVYPLDTHAGQVNLGAMICFDREFPESARILMLKGAEVIVIPNACEMEANRLGQLRARAYENMLGVALANYPKPEANGHSVAFHPVAFGENGVSRDTLIIEGGESEGIFLAHFDMDEIRTFRRHEVWGNAFRKPSRYALLTSEQVEQPFIRKDSRR